MSHNPQFEADLAPDTNQPRIRFNFDNGWSASLVIRTNPARGGPGACEATMCSIACCRTGMWKTGETIILATEAFANEAAAFIAEIAARRPVE